MNPQMLTESARRCLGALRKRCLDGLAQRDVRRRGCFAGGIERATTAIGVAVEGVSLGVANKPARCLEAVD